MRFCTFKGLKLKKMTRVFIKIIFTFTSLLLISFASCEKEVEPNNNDSNSNNGTEPPPQDEDITLTIITTNDIHGEIENFPKLATLISMKEEESDAVLVVSAGDYFSGNPYVDYADERGEPMVRLLNEIGCDIVCYGNHEFDYGQEVLKARNEQAEFEIVCGNINSSASLIGATDPYYIEEVSGLKICFLGMIETFNGNTQPTTNPANLGNITFTPYTDAAPTYGYLSEECDAFIAVSHLGYQVDFFLTKLLPSLDVIIGGHTHTVVDEKRLFNDVLVTQAGSHLEYAGVITLQFDESELVARDYELVDLSTITNEDAEVRTMVEAIKSENNFNQVIGSASQTINGSENVASFMTDAIADKTNAHFAFYNSGGVRNTVIEQGDITFQDILTIEPFANEIVTFEMSLLELKEYILRSYREIERIDYFISEGKYEIYEENGTYSVDIYDKNNQLLTDENARFTIALNNYMAATDPALGTGTSTGFLVTTAMVEFLERNSPIFYNQQRAFVLE